MATSERAEIGKYRIVGQIGEGAMGIVYRGIDPVLNRSVAIKVMSDAVARDTDLRARFLREAQSAGSLQHPNVVTVYDFGEVDGHPFIAMELVEGADLDELLQQNAPLTLVEKIDILIDVLNGLSYAHKRGIVHRDVKPANIRIDQEGRARIMDFGIAHLNSSSGTRMTRTGMMVGTPAYMSPEQITGGPITPSSDIFSMGAVMYELMAGVTAFRADTLQSIMYQIVTVPAPELPRIIPPPQGADAQTVMKSLDAIASRALHKEPAQRFETALEMATALSDVRARLVHDQSTAGPASLRASVAKAMAAIPDRPSRGVPRRWVAAAGAFAAVLVIAVILAFNRRTASVSPPATPSVATAVTTPVRPAPAPAPATLTPPDAGTASAPPSSPRASAINPPTARELALFRDLQGTALDARRRAADAGATDAALDSGDAHNRLASELLAEGKSSEAGAQLRQATAAWTRSERAARVAAASAPARPERQANVPPVSAVPPTSVAQQSSPAATSAPVIQPPAATASNPPATAAAPPTNPAADIATVVATYARALESRDVAAVRRAYPNRTQSQAKGWEQFFSTLRSLRATLAVNGLDVTGASADGRITGTYDYVTDAGKTVQQPVSFQASFRRDGGVWQLVSIR